MANFTKKAEAIALRKQEFSYSQIKQKIGVSKSTLSDWLKNYPLSKERIAELRDHNEKRIERYRETMKKKHDERLGQIYKSEKNSITPLSDRDIFMIGLGLYWGEGAKRRQATVSISNTDPSIHKFFILWLNKYLKVDKEKLRIQLHLYRDMNVEKELQFWSKILKLSKRQFTKPYIKKTDLISINHKGGFGHGTCNIAIGNVNLSEKVLMDIKIIADEYSDMRV